MYLFRKPSYLPYLLVGLIYLIVIVPAPGLSFSDAGHDDGLFMKWSVSILNRQWLGPWDVLTTSKGPLHSLLTAVAANLGINPFAYKRIFYLTGSLVFVATGLNKAPIWLRLLTLLTLLSDPFQYGTSGVRNLREGTYIPLQMIAFGLGNWSLDQLREQNKIRALLVAAILGTAVSFGLLLVTREARMVVWIELTAWMLLSWSLLAWRHRHKLHRRLGIKVLCACLSMLLIIGFARLPIFFVNAVNAYHYHYAISSSTEEGGFPRLYGRLLGISVKGELSIARVPVRQSTLDALINDAAMGSPLRMILEGIPSSWKNPGCDLYPQTCGEIAGGWFIWALRDGIALSLAPGSSEDAFQRIVKSAENDLVAICKQSSTLRCSETKAGYLPYLSRWGFHSPMIETAMEGAKIASLLMIPSVYPDGKVDLASRDLDTKHARLATPLGIMQTALSSAYRGQRIFGLVSFLGAAGKWGMIIISVIAIVLAAIRERLIELFDPVSAWMLLSLALHMSMYTLLGLTSFPGYGYVTMASPIYIGFLARLSAVLMPTTEH